MSSKPKKSKRTWVELYRSIRKPPVPPGRTIQPKDRDIVDEEDDREIARWEGWRGEDFEEYEE